MDDVRRLVSTGRLAEALDLLGKNVREALQDEVDILQGRLNRLGRDERMGVLSYTEAGLERNRITDAILKLHAENEQPQRSLVSRGNLATPKGVQRLPKLEPKQRAANEKKSILFVTASPDDETKLQTDREYRRLRAELERGRQRDQYEFLHPQFAVTVSELLRAMNSNPTIVHFAGHGYSDGIVITTESNQTQPMSLRALRRLFQPRAGLTELVILNACYSAEQAKEISQFGMFVIGNNNPISDPAAISFSDGFYNGLGEGKDLPDAFNDAMITIETENSEAADIIEVWKDGERLQW